MNPAPEPGTPRLLSTTLILFLLGLLTLAAPPAVWLSRLWMSSSIYGELIEPVELFSLCGSLALLLGAGLWLRARPARSLEDKITFSLGLAVGLFYLTLLSLFSTPSWDYQAYQDAAGRIITGRNPYGADSFYLYPPLLAQLMALAFRAFPISLLPDGADPAQHLPMLVFFLYQAGQFYSALLAYFLAAACGRQLGIKPIPAAGLAAGLLMLSTPALSTLRETQINFWVLDSILACLVLVRRRPGLAGAALAVGIHLKLYPVIVLAPWLFARQWKPLAGATIAVLVIFLLQTSGGDDLELWRQFLDRLLDFPVRRHFRNNSLTGLAYSLFSAASHAGAGDIDSFAPAIRVAAGLAGLGVTGWMAMRFVRREREFAAAPADDTTSYRRLTGHAADALAWSLMVSPIAWSHHFLLAVPLLLVVIARRGRREPGLLIAGAFLAFGLPNFDFFLLSAHRLAGLLILLVLAARPLPSQTPAVTETAPEHQVKL